MLQARITKRFPAGSESAAFTLQVEFQAGAGITVLFGPSGAGKTLTLDAVAGFVRPDEGRILLDDEILFDGATRVHLPPRARHCGYVFQNYALFPHLTLRENLEFAVLRRSRLDRRRRVNEMIERFRLADVAGRRPHELSGGQKQRCSIARALIGAPKLLLLDEPARGLDAPLRAELYAILRRVRAEFRTPILLVTHDLEECFELGEEMLVLREGRVAQAGPPRRVVDQPASVEVARLLGLFLLLPAEIVALDPGRNSSRVRYGEFELAGPYFPGHFKGDRVCLCARPGQLRAAPRDGRPGANQVPAQLLSVVDKPSTVRLEFSGEIAVEMPRASYEPLRQTKEWVVEFPPEALRVV
jgi:molybdate transport system ATP-binding protein